MTRASFCHPEPRRGYSSHPEPRRGSSSQPEPRRGFSNHPEPRRGSCHTQNPPPPWGVPMKRKPRGERRTRDYYYYDPFEKDLFLYRDGEITTQNRFLPLFELSTNMNSDYYPEEELQTFYCKDCEINSALDKKIPRTVCFQNLKDFMKTAREHFLCNDCTCNNINTFMLNNKYNMCSGYFCDSIYYPPVDRQVPYGNGYIKQLSNMYSKYNIDYFSKMSSIYKISKKFWKPQEASPSCGTVANSSGIGTNEETLNTHHSIQTHSNNKINKKNIKMYNSIKCSNKKYNNNSNNNSSNSSNNSISNNNENNNHSTNKI